MVGLQRNAGLRRLGFGVLDCLGFVEYRVTEAGLGQQVGMATQLSVAGDPKLGRRIRVEVFVSCKHGHAGAHLRMEALDFAEPNRNDTGWADNDGPFANRARSK